LTLSVFLATIIPLFFLVGLLKKENRALMLFFCWGLFAFILSYYGNSFIMQKIHIERGEQAVSMAPIVEEFFKFLPLLIFLFVNVHSKYSIIYFGMAIGIGFSIQENYLYLSHYHMSGNESALALVVFRSMSTSLMHGLTTALIGFGLCVIKDFKVFTFPLTFGLFSIAVISHSLFNLYIDSNLKIIGLVMPLAAYAMALTALYSLEDFRENH
jgi:RsiW-degrading membrane proteinase PrsW (M82 family)